MDTIPTFPKLPAYRGSADLLHTVRRVVCLEKIDGANTRIAALHEHVSAGLDGPEALIVGGRSLLESDPGFNQDFLGPIARDNRALHTGLVELVREHSGDVVLYGETCGGRIQRMGFIYGSRTHFLLFGARIGGAWCSWSVSPSRSGPALPTLQQLAERLGVPTPPLLYEGEPDSERFESLLGQTSAHSLRQGFERSDVEPTQEGIVIWADPLLRTPEGDPLVAKLKHPSRREYSPPAGDDGVQGFAERAVPLERIHHGIEHLRGSGRWRGAPLTRLDRLVRRVIQDVAREVPEYQDQIALRGKEAVRAALGEAVRRQAEALDLGEG